MLEAQQFLRATFAQHSLEAARDESRGFSFAFEAVAGAGAGPRVGAVAGMAYFGLLVVSLFAVEPAHRSRGVGAALLAAALARGRERGCSHAVVETMDFQAAPFYVRHGFVEVARVAGFDQGAELIRLVRAL